MDCFYIFSKRKVTVQLSSLRRGKINRIEFKYFPLTWQTRAHKVVSDSRYRFRSPRGPSEGQANKITHKNLAFGSKAALVRTSRKSHSVSAISAHAMAHGGYGKRRVNPAGRRSKGLGVEKKPKPKSVSLKNQIRSIERMLRKVATSFVLLQLLVGHFFV